MKKKDISLRTLEQHAEVFADIVHVLFLKKNLQICSGELLDCVPAAGYVAGDGCVRELIRDVVKKWFSAGKPVAILGIENQSSIDKYMPLRIAAYDGVDYRNQLIHYQESIQTNDLINAEVPVPVVTLVLYTGTNTKWKKPLELADSTRIPKSLKPYVTNHKIKVINLAWLSPRIIRSFKSDFRHVADMCRQLRLNKCYKPKRGIKVRHPYDLAMVWYAFTGDKRITSYFTPEMNDQESDMCKFLDSIEAKGLKKGLKQGKAQGLKQGKAQGLKQGKAQGIKQGTNETAAIYRYMKSIGRESEFEKVFQSRRFYLKMLREAQTIQVAAEV